MKKRILPLLLAFCMVVTLVPMTVISTAASDNIHYYNNTNLTIPLVENIGYAKGSSPNQKSEFPIIWKAENEDMFYLLAVGQTGSNKIDQSFLDAMEAYTVPVTTDIYETLDFYTGSTNYLNIVKASDPDSEIKSFYGTPSTTASSSSGNSDTFIIIGLTADNIAKRAGSADSTGYYHYDFPGLEAGGFKADPMISAYMNEVIHKSVYLTLQYDANGGKFSSVQPDVEDPSDTVWYEKVRYQLVEKGSKEVTGTFTIRDWTPSRAGYNFLGWAESKTATSPSSDFAAGSSYTMTLVPTTADSKVKTIYGVWEEKQELSFVANSKRATYNAANQTVEGYKLTLGGKTFLSDPNTGNLTFTVAGKEALKDTYTVSGLSASATGRNVGIYPSVLEGTPVITDSKGNDVTDKFIINPYTDGELEITKAPVTITVDSKWKWLYEDDPVFTGTVNGVKGSDNLNVSYHRTNASVNTEGEYPQVLDASYTENTNYTVKVVKGDFEIIRKKVNLKINKVYDGDFDSDQTCIFRIQGPDDSTEKVDMKVVIKGQNSVTVTNVPAGTYTVTELTDWSWRYDAQKDSDDKDEVKTVLVKNDGTSEVTFTNKNTTRQWQSALADVKNACMSEIATKGEL